MFLAGFFIFYCIDNPDFLKGRFSFLSGSGAGDERKEIIPETPLPPGQDQLQSSENEEEVAAAFKTAGTETDENEIVESEIADAAAEVPPGGVDKEEIIVDSGSGLSFWQKIKNFFMGILGREQVEESGEAYPARIEINFYFSGTGEEKKLVSEKRTINAGSPEIAAQNAVQELLKGPARAYHFPVIPAGTKLLGVETKDNIAKIDLSREFLENSLDTRILDEYVIYSIVNTLTEIPGIEGILFYIEGVRIRVYGNMDLSIPAIRNKELINEE